MRKLISVILIICIMLLSTVSFASGAAGDDIQKTVNDISKGLNDIVNGISGLVEDVANILKDIEGHWAKSYITKLSELGIVSGYGDGTFGPNDSIARDAFIKMTVVAMGYDPGNAQGYWAQNYLDKAIELNLIAADEFSSYTEPIKREEMASIVVNAVLKDEFEHNVNLYDYVREDIKDYGAISDKYKQKVLNSYGYGLITGFDGYFRPQGTASRAEASTIINRYIDKNIRQPYQVDASVPTVDLVNVLNKIQTMTVYPKRGAEEMITVAKILKATVELGEGYGDLIFNPLENLVAVAYYPKKSDLDLSSIHRARAMDFSFTIYTLNWGERHSAPYGFSVWDQEDIKKYHLDVFEVIFSALFESEKDFAMEKLMKHLNNEYGNEEFTCNGRTVWFFDADSGGGFGLYVSLKNQ